jgi:orotate phosphoribosyltransferase-like protein|tara:strand:+ start:1089 stop:1352 length:264 start_codon:yes stop_codon:yes gene_type:complete
MIKEMAEAGKKIHDICVQGEDELWSFNQLIDKLSVEVKVHGVPFPTLMFIEIVEKFVDERPQRRKSETFDEADLQEGYARVSAKWIN